MVSHIANEQLKIVQINLLCFFAVSCPKELVQINQKIKNN